jgi:uncharacterized protein YyaL (SSP411 family)
MIKRLKGLAGNRDNRALARAIRGCVRAHRTGPECAAPLRHHLEATYRWLCTAQDATPDGGVAGFLDLWSGRWSESYPETTGYIIPTFLALAGAHGDAEARERALRMADWSCDVQMEDGAVLSGVLGTRRAPAVFNTGQAIFGWVSAYQASGRDRYATAARDAAEWLLRCQDYDGAWRRNLSAMTSTPVHTYNGRCAWALAYAANALGEERFADAAHRASDWVLTQQNEAGWFAHTAFSEDETPLLHTISYVIEGLVGVYAFTGESKYLEAARRALEPIIALYRAGHLAGRLDERWRGVVPWRCVTGDAQVATVLHRLDQHCPRNGYAQTARQLISEVAGIQRALTGGNDVTNNGGPAVVGVPGSFPIWGQYMRFALPNWAAKFYLDALLLETEGVDEYGFPALAAV